MRCWILCGKADAINHPRWLTINGWYNNHPQIVALWHWVSTLKEILPEQVSFISFWVRNQYNLPKCCLQSHDSVFALASSQSGGRKAASVCKCLNLWQMFVMRNSLKCPIFAAAKFIWNPKCDSIHRMTASCTRLPGPCLFWLGNLRSGKMIEV